MIAIACPPPLLPSRTPFFYRGESLLEDSCSVVVRNLCRIFTDQKPLLYCCTLHRNPRPHFFSAGFISSNLKSLQVNCCNFRKSWKSSGHCKDLLKITKVVQILFCLWPLFYRTSWPHLALNFASFWNFSTNFLKHSIIHFSILYYVSWSVVVRYWNKFNTG